MSIANFPINLLSKSLSDYDIGKCWAVVNSELETYLLDEGYHSINEVPHGTEPLDDKKLNEEFVWMPWSESNSRILVALPLSNENTEIFENVNSRVVLSSDTEILGIGKFIGQDFSQEYYQFDFGPDLVKAGSYLYYDKEKIKIDEPTKRLGNGIKEKFFANGGAGLEISVGGSGGGGHGGSGGPKGGNILPGAPSGFLWKPVSESNRKLVVLLPERKLGFCRVNGIEGRYTGQANGNRAHYRFDVPGSAFPENVVCQTSVGNFTIPTPALRWEA